MSRCIIRALLLLVVTAGLTASRPALAQINLDPEATGVQYSLLPLLGYESDMGLVGGGYLERIDYGEGVRPFVNSTSVEVTVSTKGHLISVLDHERINSFGTDIRSRIRVEGIRIQSAAWFGIGNETRFSRSAYDDNFYFYEDRRFRVEYWGRKEILELGEQGQLDAHFIGLASYTLPGARSASTLFAQSEIPGSEGGWVNQVGFGLIFDSRGSEFDPDSGIRAETNIRFSGRLTGSHYAFTTYLADLRHYISPIRNVVLAQRLELRHATGETPFWELPLLGNEMGLRGYVNNRFRGETSIVHNAEIRSWLFSLLDDQVRLGAQLFVDSGRVFAGDDSLSDLPGGLKHTIGFGGAFSVLNPDFIFRGDLAFSEDIYRIYLGIGYSF